MKINILILSLTFSIFNLNSIEIKKAEYCQTKINETSILELGIDSFISDQSPFIEIDSNKIAEIDIKLDSSIIDYLKNEGITNADSKFLINKTVRQYSGLKSKNETSILLIRFYSKSRLIIHYGDQYLDRLCNEGYSYFHFYPDFYFLIYDLEKGKIIFMRW